MDLNGALQFSILGLGAGAVFAMLAQGVVLIYRGSGTVNFAHGAMAMIGAYIYWDLRWDELSQETMAFVPAFLIAVVAVGLLGALIHLLIMRPLARSAPIIRVIATLALLTVLTGAVKLYWGSDIKLVRGSLPMDRWHWGDITIQADRIWLVAIATSITVVLWLVFRFTRFGLAVVAAAEDERAASALGWSPDLLATVNWAAGGALAAVAGILVVPIIGLEVDKASIALIAALAAALLAGFSSFWLALAGGLAIGIAQSLVVRFVDTSGMGDAVPFVLILVVLVLRGRALPLRSHVLEQMPKLGTGRLPAWLLVVPAAVAALALTVFSVEWSNTFATSLVWAVLILSIVVVTGFAGQISLAQVALAGLGALVAARLVAENDLPFEVALLAGVAAATLLGLVFALPALRTRGLNLAVATLGLGLAVQSVVFLNADLTGSASGLSVGETTFLGIQIDRINHPDRYMVFVLAWLVLVIVAVLNIRRGRAGRRLIAIRTNERAAASLGVSVFGAKLYAFAVSSAIAGLGGVLLAFRDRTVLFDANYSAFASINLVVLAVLGGVGYALGAIPGSTLAVGGIGALITSRIGVDDEWITLVGGIFLLVQLILVPDGMASHMFRFLEKPSRAARKEAEAEVPSDVAGDEITPERVPEAQLAVRDVTVRVGGVYAVHDASLEVRTGEVVGLIGPNGAGKTTMIDAITGFVRPLRGTVHFNGADVTRWPAARRKRAGFCRTFQSLELFEDLSVRDNLLAGADDLGAMPYLTDIVWPRKEHLPEAALRAVKDLDLEAVLDVPASDLPYGQRRLVSIARALASTPSILLLDEPAAGLSDAETAELRHLIRRLAEEWGIGVLLVEHDMSLVMAVCDRIVALETGEVIAEGSPAEIARDVRVRAAYLGDAVTESADDEGPVSELDPAAHRPFQSSTTP